MPARSILSFLVVKGDFFYQTQQLISQASSSRYFSALSAPVLPFIEKKAVADIFVRCADTYPG